MAYRYRMQCIAQYGYFNEVVSAFHQLNEICLRRNWTPFRVLTPVVGEGNAIVVERDFPDLVSFERQMTEFYADPEAMKVFRSSAASVVQGSNRDELYHDAPTLA